MGGQRSRKIFLWTVFFLRGALVLCAFSTLQKILNQSPIELSLKAYFFPFVFGGIGGILVGERSLKLKSYARVLERDRTEKEKRLNFLQSLLDAIPNPIFFKDAQGKYLGCNFQFENFMGVPREELIGKGCADLFPEDRSQICQRMDEELFNDPRGYAYEARLNDAQGRFRTIIFNKAPFFTRGGKLAGLVGTLLDITEQKKAEEKISTLAYFDALTGLPNRWLLRDRLDQALAKARREKSLIAVLFLDLEDFKNVNDTLGHPAGDQLLRDVAERLQETVRESDTVARLGGDEFVILLTSIREEADVLSAIQQFLRRFSAPFSVQGREIFTGCRIGIAFYPADGDDADTLLKNADMAMYEAKATGRNSYQFYSEQMNRRVVERIELEMSFRKGLQEREFFLMYQPQMDFRSGRIVGMEVLSRWRHPRMGMVSPSRFIPLAEETGLILSLGEWCLRTACAQCRSWQDRGYPSLRLAVNVSTSQLRQPGFVEMVDRILEETRFSPSLLELELTESVLMNQGERMQEILRELKARGIRLSIDDFGTGYSSLSYLQDFPIDRVKIAQNFVREVPDSPSSAVLVETIIAMALSLDLDVIAEGVETERQMQFLLARNCHEMQGFFFSRPLSADVFPEFAFPAAGEVRKMAH